MEEIDRILNDFEWIWTIWTVPGAYRSVLGALNWRQCCFGHLTCVWGYLKGLREFVSLLWTYCEYTVSILGSFFALPCSSILPRILQREWHITHIFEIAGENPENLPRENFPLPGRFSPQTQKIPIRYVT